MNSILIQLLIVVVSFVAVVLFKRKLKLETNIVTICVLTVLFQGISTILFTLYFKFLA